MDFTKLDGIKRTFEKGSTLYYEGDSIDYHFLVSGCCKAYKSKGFECVSLYFLKSGELISDVGGVALSSVEFLEDSVVFSVSHTQLFAYQDFLFKELLKRNKLLDHCLNINLSLNPLQRIAYFLLNDLKGFNYHKRRDIAALLNIKGETLSRGLKKLVIKECISVESGVVEVIDESLLKEILSSG